MNGITAYALARKYTDETAQEFGGLKGASCQIQSIVKTNNRNIVTFLWVNSQEQERTSTMIVEDGTPIYEWHSGDHYEYGDLAIYASCFYRCTTENSDIEFDDTKWEELGSPDGNYDIIQNSSQLPPVFTPADRKMYYSIADKAFWLWNGTEWVIQQQPVQFDTMPTAQESNVGRILQYTGTTTQDYTKGYWYTCEETAPDSGMYHWVEIDVQAGHIEIDDELSPTSENPVQNKVITHTISTINSDISAEVSAREALDSRLSLAISTLISDLNTEVSTRTNAISELQTALELAVSTLNTEVSQERSARAAEDSRLAGLISTLNSEVDSSAGAIEVLQSDLANKVDKVVGKGLSTFDYDSTEKGKVASAQQQTLSNPITVDGVQQTTVEGTLNALNTKTVNVDSQLSTVSENPVQNKVITNELNNKQVDVGLSIVNGRICVTYDVEEVVNGELVTRQVVAPIMLDTTGQALVNATNAIAEAINENKLMTVTELPTPVVGNLGASRILIEEQNGYIKGGLYKCALVQGSDPATYEWVLKGIVVTADGTSTEIGADGVIHVLTSEIAVDYNNVINKPSINGVELDGDMTPEEMGIDEELTTEQMDALTNLIT